MFDHFSLFADFSKAMNKSEHANNKVKFIPDYMSYLNIPNPENLELPLQMNPKDRHSTIELSRQYMRIIYQGS